MLGSGTLCSLASTAHYEPLEKGGAPGHAAASQVRLISLCGGADFRSSTAVMLAGTLVLAGCGGGSDAPTDPVDTPDPAIEKRAAIATAIDTAATAVGMVDNEATDAEVTAADNAITAAKAAIAAATDVPADEKAANSKTVTAYETALTTAKAARKMAMDDADAAAAKAMTAKAKALMKAINAASATATSPAIPNVDTDGDGDGTVDDNTGMALKKGDAVVALGSWMGTGYAGSAGTGDAKITGTARAYSNQAAAESHSFVSEAGEAIHGLARYTTSAATGDYSVGIADSSNIGGFPAAGTSTYDEDDTVSGTYMKAPGTYTCIATACPVVATTSGVTVTDAQWTFTPSAGAMLQKTDAAYLQFGWWLREDKDGATHAGVFYGSGGSTALTPANGLIDNAALVGKATYKGSAAGKFAVNDPLRPADDNAGHFTADAELNADFKATGSTLSGTINAFRLNGGSDDPLWSIALQKTVFNGNEDKFTTNDTRADDQTVWSINGASGGISGNWEAQMFDENANDGSNVPTSAVGKFTSSIGTTHSMTGAFGAER